MWRRLCSALQATYSSMYSLFCIRLLPLISNQIIMPLPVYLIVDILVHKYCYTQRTHTQRYRQINYILDTFSKLNAQCGLSI